MLSVVQTKLRSIALVSMMSSLAWSGATCSSYAMGTFPRDVPVVTVECPPLKKYTKETVEKVGREMRNIITTDPRAASPDMIADYKLLRDQCRALEKK